MLSVILRVTKVSAGEIKKFHGAVYCEIRHIFFDFELRTAKDGKNEDFSVS